MLLDITLMCIFGALIGFACRGRLLVQLFLSVLVTLVYGVLAAWVAGTLSNEMSIHDISGTVYYHTDAEGSVVALTNSSGNVIERYKYDAFGKPSFFDSTSQPINGSTVGNRFLFTGREWLPDLGLYDYRNRAYSPELGRFLQTDPKSFDADPSNLYRYCGNDPIDKTDPMGLDTIIIFNDVIHYYENPFGHVAIATTGQGIHSHGNNPSTAQHTNYSHASTTDYLEREAKKRDTVIVRIKTTPAQEKKINEYMDSLKDKKTGKLDNCARRTEDALNHAGLNVVPTTFPGEVLGQAQLGLHGTESRINKGEGKKAVQYREFNPAPKPTEPEQPKEKPEEHPPLQLINKVNSV